MLIRGREVLAITGLTADQLREWTVRRALVQPDEPAQKRGSEARFSWQTVLLLCLVQVLRGNFHIELQAHRELLSSIHDMLRNASFLALRGRSIVIYAMQQCELITVRDSLANEDVLLLRLDKHLAVISGRFGLLDAGSQFSLFPAVSVDGGASTGRRSLVGKPRS